MGTTVNHPDVPVSRLQGVMMIEFFATAAALSLTFTKHKETVLDRVGLFIFVLCFFWQAVAPRVMIVALGIGFTCLIGAWGYDRLQRRRRPDNNPPDPNHVVA